MSHTHEDRIAERAAHLCTAYGCPLMGTMSASTSGTTEWWCPLHIGKDGIQMQLVTSAINRHRWLANAITDIRSMVPARTGKGQLLERIWNDCVTNNRKDLYWAHTQETARQWVNRLEPEFDKLVMADLELPAKQQALPTDTWQEAGKAMPAWA